MQKRKLLILGSRGYIGRNLVEYFTDKYPLYTPSHQELDLLDTKKVYKYIVKNNIDYIIHSVNVGGARNEIGKTNIAYINLRIFFNVVRNVKLVKKIIFFGSGAEYDKTRPLKNVSEEHFDKRVPSDEYGLYKYICSKYIEYEPSRKIISLRLFGTYGKYDNYLVRFVTNSILKNIFHQPININQNVYFDYLFIEDLMPIVDYFLTNPSKFNIYNVVPGKRVDLITIANIVNEVSDYKSQVNVLNPGLNIEYTGFNKRLRNEIKNLRLTPLKQGIKKMFHWYKNNLDKIDMEKVIKDEYIKYCKVKVIR